MQRSANGTSIPNGEYFISKRIINLGVISAKMEVKNGKIILQKGSKCVQRKSTVSNSLPEIVREAQSKIKNRILQEDIECASPNVAAYIVFAEEVDGWEDWKTYEGVIFKWCL